MMQLGGSGQTGFGNGHTLIVNVDAGFEGVDVLQEWYDRAFRINREAAWDNGAF